MPDAPLILNITGTSLASFCPRFDIMALTSISSPVIGVEFERLKLMLPGCTSRSGPGSTFMTKYETAVLSALSVAYIVTL